MSKLQAYNELFLGRPEINRMIEFLGEKGFQKILADMSQSFGIIKNNRSSNWTSFQIYQSSFGKIGLRAGVGIDSDGNIIRVEADIPDIATPPLGATTDVFIKYATTHVEPIKILDITGDIVTGGVGEEWLKKLVPGSLIELVNSAEGNTGVYEVLDVVDDNTIQIDTVLAAEANISYIIQGRFTPSVAIPDGDKRHYFLDSFVLELLPSPALVPSKAIQLATVTNTVGAITVQDFRSLYIHRLKEPYVRPFDSAFTMSPSFKVGTTDVGAGGRYVMLEPDLPSPLLNLRIFEIAAIGAQNISQIDPGYIDNIAGEAIGGGSTINSDLHVKIKWGWDYIVGIGGSGSFTINNGAGEEYEGKLPDIAGVLSSGTFVNDCLIGYYLWVPQVSKSVLITGNVGNVLSVTESDGTSIDLTGISPSSANPAWLTVDADRYSVVAIPYNPPGFIDPIWDNIVESQVTITPENAIGGDGFGTPGNPTFMEKVLNLQSGKRYVVKVQAHLLNRSTNWYEMPAGHYYKYGVIQNYSKPALMIHPQISAVGASIGSTPTANGFRITINGWTAAQNFQLVYTTDNAGASYTNPNHTKLFTTNRVVDISTSSSAAYNIKVRPLIAGFQVSPPLSTNVQSGSSGVPPSSIQFINTVLQHRTYSGTINVTDLGSGYQQGVLSVIRTPSGGGTVVTILPSFNDGKIFTVNAHNYMIETIVNNNTIVFKPWVDDTGTGMAPMLPNGSVHSFSLGTSKKGRKMASVALPLDAEILRIEFDCNILHISPVTLRVYQLATENLSDNILLEQDDTPYGVNSDVVVNSVNGARTLIIDLWDPQDYPSLGDPQKNTGGVTGRLIVYGKYVYQSFVSNNDA